MRIPFGRADPFVLRDAERGEQCFFGISVEGLAGYLLDDSGENLCEGPVVVPSCAGLLSQWTREDEFNRVLNIGHLQLVVPRVRIRNRDFVPFQTGGHGEDVFECDRVKYRPEFKLREEGTDGAAQGSIEVGGQRNT